MAANCSRSTSRLSFSFFYFLFFSASTKFSSKKNGRRGNRARPSFRSRPPHPKSVPTIRELANVFLISRKRDLRVINYKIIIIMRYMRGMLRTGQKRPPAATIVVPNVTRGLLSANNEAKAPPRKCEQSKAPSLKPVDVPRRENPSKFGEKARAGVKSPSSGSEAWSLQTDECV